MNDVTRTFAALSDAARLKMVEHLLKAGEAPAGELSALVDISAPAVSRHLKVLTAAGVLARRAKGTHRYYRINPQAMAALDGWMETHRAFWTASLDRLDGLLKEEDG